MYEITRLMLMFVNRLVASKLTIECFPLSNFSRFFRKLVLNSAVFLTEKVQMLRSGLIKLTKKFSALLVTAP